ncbi:MAG: NAD(+)/NADH kinase [Clostridia bacterium]|nr:NAD(+)/NADH kinase [Clostridia bacterium]
MKHIVIYANPDKDKGLVCTTKLKSIIENASCKVDVITDPERFSDNGVPELLIVLGGDGTIMHAARCCSYAGVPILGINFGRVGFMAELNPDEIVLVEEYINGNYSIEERMMLAVKTESGDEFCVLNDAVVSNGTVSKITTLDLYCNDSFVAEYNADGLIIATPTGSTAYSMSAGGPLIDPSLACLLSTPICPHSLTSRPMVFSADSVIKIVNKSPDSVSVYLTLDGRENINIPFNASITVKRAKLVTKLIRIKNDGFYNLLGKKMN